MAVRMIATPTRFCVFHKAASGDPDAPFRDPADNVRAIIFEASFGYYQVAASADPVINHAAVAADGGSRFSGPGGSVTVYTQRVTASFVLLTHNLGVVPRVKVADANLALISPARPIQAASAGVWTAYRTARIRATTTQIILDEIAIPANVGLPAVSATYHVRVFSPAGPVAGQPGLLARPTVVEMAQGAVNSAQRSLRIARAGEAHMVKPMSRASDINNGQFRFRTADGTIYDTNMVVGSSADGYAGPFAGPALLDVVL